MAVAVDTEEIAIGAAVAMVASECVSGLVVIAIDLVVVGC